MLGRAGRVRVSEADGEIWIGGGIGLRMRAMPLLGGTIRNFMDPDVVNVDWSPDGRRMAFHHRTSGDPLFVAETNADAVGNESTMATSLAVLGPPFDVTMT